jgi:repressor LexA
MLDTTRPALTERQQFVYDLICESIRKLRRPPSVRDLMERLALKSPNGVVCHLHALKKKGYITHDRGIARGLRVVDHSVYRPPYSIPIVGRVSAGPPLVAYELLEWLSLPDLLGDDIDLTAVQVEGNGMLERNISDGDFLIQRAGRDVLLWRPIVF